MYFFFGIMLECPVGREHPGWNCVPGCITGDNPVCGYDSHGPGKVIYTTLRDDSPEGGDFLYSDLEFEVMKEDIRFAKECRADGVVLGILNADGSVDVQRTRELVELAAPLKVTFHRAIDMTRDMEEALEGSFRPDVTGF